MEEKTRNSCSKLKKGEGICYVEESVVGKTGRVAACSRRSGRQFSVAWWSTYLQQ
jgi:hypothetical protein